MVRSIRNVAFISNMYSANHYACVVRLNKSAHPYPIVHAQVNTENRRVASQEVLGKRPVQILEKIRENLERLNEKMEVMIELQKQGRKNVEQLLPDAPLDVMTLLSMPDHLRKTAMTVCRLGRATADETAQQTHRARAVESAYLNQLVIMGHLKKERKGRKAYFYIEREAKGDNNG